VGFVVCELGLMSYVLYSGPLKPVNLFLFLSKFVICPSLIIKSSVNLQLHTLQMLFKGFPEECNALKSLKDGALSTGSSSKWSTEWATYALPVVNQVNVNWFSTIVITLISLGLILFHTQFAGCRMKH
jgi:hypothetical protein